MGGGLSVNDKEQGNLGLRSCGAPWGPHGDHTVCAVVVSMPSTARPDLGDGVHDVRGRVTKRPGGQGVVGSNPAVPTARGFPQVSDLRKPSFYCLTWMPGLARRCWTP